MNPKEQIVCPDSSKVWGTWWEMYQMKTSFSTATVWWCFEKSVNWGGQHLGQWPCSHGRWLHCYQNCDSIWQDVLVVELLPATWLFLKCIEAGSSLWVIFQLGCDLAKCWVPQVSLAVCLQASSARYVQRISRDALRLSTDFARSKESTEEAAAKEYFFRDQDVILSVMEVTWHSRAILWLRTHQSLARLISC